MPRERGCFRHGSETGERVLFDSPFGFHEQNEVQNENGVGDQTAENVQRALRAGVEIDEDLLARGRTFPIGRGLVDVQMGERGRERDEQQGRQAQQAEEAELCRGETLLEKEDQRCDDEQIDDDDFDDRGEPFAELQQEAEKGRRETLRDVHDTQREDEITHADVVDEKRQDVLVECRDRRANRGKKRRPNDLRADGRVRSKERHVHQWTGHAMRFLVVIGLALNGEYEQPIEENTDETDGGQKHQLQSKHRVPVSCQSITDR